jgi:hypothetical protein
MKQGKDVSYPLAVVVQAPAVPLVLVEKLLVDDV